VFERIRSALGVGGAAQSHPLVAYAERIKTMVATLPDWQQAAFAAGCAERLYPPYAAFRRASGTNDNGVVRGALDLAWAGAATGSVSDTDAAALVKRCVRLIPDEDADFTIPDHAENAISGAVYALEAAAGLRAGAAGWAAEVGTNALDSYLLATQAIPWSGASRDGRATMEQRVWQHALVQAEVARRDADLARLARGDRDAAIGDVRARSMIVTLLPLGELDNERGDER
jgi:uncharacterized protein YjaG (DUF416 family)